MSENKETNRVKISLEVIRKRVSRTFTLLRKNLRTIEQAFQNYDNIIQNSNPAAHQDSINMPY